MIKEKVLHLDCPDHGERSSDQVRMDTDEIFLCWVRLEGGGYCEKVAVPHIQFYEETDTPVCRVHGERPEDEVIRSQGRRYCGAKLEEGKKGRCPLEVEVVQEDSGGKEQK